MATNVSSNIQLGRVHLYVAPAPTADPVFATMPTGAWVYVGWMESATALQATVGEMQLNVDDLIVPVDSIANSRTAGVTGAMAEFLLANVQLAWGGTLTSVAAATGVAGYDQLTLKGSDDITRKSVVVDQQDPREVAAGTSVGVGRMRIYFPYAAVSSNGNPSLSRKGQANIPFAINAHPALDGSETLGIVRKATAIGI